MNYFHTITISSIVIREGVTLIQLYTHSMSTFAFVILVWQSDLSRIICRNSKIVRMTYPIVKLVTWLTGDNCHSHTFLNFVKFERLTNGFFGKRHKAEAATPASPWEFGKIDFYPFKSLWMVITWQVIRVNIIFNFYKKCR